MPGKDSSEYFGYVIAFVLPGFLALWVVSHFDPVSAGWLGTLATKDLTVGAFLFAGLASLGLGMFLGGARWLVFDLCLMPLLRVPDSKPLDQAKRKDLEAPYRAIIEDHYRFYQFYANSAVALALAALVLWSRLPAGALVLLLGTEAVLIVSARDALKKHRTKVEQLLGLYSPGKAA